MTNATTERSTVSKAIKGRKPKEVATVEAKAKKTRKGTLGFPADSECYYTIAWHTSRWTPMMNTVERQSVVKTAIKSCASDSLVILDTKVFPAFVVVYVLAKDVDMPVSSIVSKLKSTAAREFKESYTLTSPCVFTRASYISTDAPSATKIAKWLADNELAEPGYRSAENRALIAVDKTIEAMLQQGLPID